MDNEKFFFARVKSINDQDRTIEVIASTADIDRDNEIILPSAFIETLDSFKQNPVVLCAHQHRLESGDSPVIGSADNIVVTDKGLQFRVKFASTELGKQYCELYKEHHMRGLSVGFIPIQGAFRKMNGKDVYQHEKIELLEVSCVAVPSNRAALARAKRLGWLDAKKDQHEDEKVLAEIRKEYQEQGRDFDQESNEFAEALLGVGKYANSETIKSLQDEDASDDDEVCDNILPDCAVLVRGR